MAIQPLQLPPIISLPTPDFSVLGDIGKNIGDYRLRQQAPDLIAGAFGAQQPNQPLPQPTAQETGAPLNAIGTGSTNPGIGSDYAAATRSVESSGNPSARNPNSSAGGLYQFTDGTWLQNFDKTFPQYAGLSPQQKLAYKTDASPQGQQVQNAVFHTFTSDNAKALSSSGLPVNNATLYAAHFFGAGDAPKVLTADPSAPLASVVQPQTIAANPFLANMTVGQAQQWLAQKMGGSSIPANATPAQYQGQGAQPSASPGAQPTMAPGAQPQTAMPGLTPQMAQRIGAMLTNPYTAQLGQALLQKYAAPSYGFMQGPNGTIFRTDALHGTLTPAAQSMRPEIKQVAEDMMGNKTFAQVYPDGRIVPLGQGGTPQGATGNPTGGVGSINGVNYELKGDQFLKQFAPDIQQAVKDYVDGRSTPTGNPRKGYTQLIKQLAAKYANDTGTYADDTSFTARREMRNQLARSTPGSLGGQINFGGTSLGHLAEVAEKASNLGNWGGFGFAPLAKAENLARGLSTEQASKVNDVQDAVQHYGQEITKFYTGSPGGETERLRFLNTMDAAKSPQEIAGAIRAERDLIPSRLQQIHDQIADRLGPAEADKQMARAHLDQVVPRINAALAKLDPIGPEAKAQAEPKQGAAPKMQTFATPRDVFAAMKAGKLKSGDQFMTPDGQIRVAK